MPLEIAQRVNVDGTGNVVELCAAAENLERHVYISTAYVAGRRTGTVYEHELVLGQDFKNHYESTKFQAEVWVRESMSQVPTTILRPAIVVGDSKTGETQKFDGPYFILRVIAEAARLSQPPLNFGRSDAPFNAVPVDYVVEAIAAAASDPAASGETLHLVDTDPLSARELTEALSMAYSGRAPRGRLAPSMVSNSMRLPAMRGASAAHLASRSPISIIPCALTPAAQRSCCLPMGSPRPVFAATSNRWSSSSGLTRMTRPLCLGRPSAGIQAWPSRMSRPPKS